MGSMGLLRYADPRQHRGQGRGEVGPGSRIKAHFSDLRHRISAAVVLQRTLRGQTGQSCPGYQSTSRGLRCPTDQSTVGSQYSWPCQGLAAAWLLLVWPRTPYTAPPPIPQRMQRVRGTRAENKCRLQTAPHASAAGGQGTPITPTGEGVGDARIRAVKGGRDTFCKELCSACVGVGRAAAGTTCRQQGVNDSQPHIHCEAAPWRSSKERAGGCLERRVGYQEVQPMSGAMSFA